MKKKLLAGLATWLFMFGLAGAANAALVDFDDIGYGSHSSYSYSDITTGVDLLFDPTSLLWGDYRQRYNASSTLSTMSTNGTYNLQYSGVLEVTDQSGNGFTLNSLDIGHGLYMTTDSGLPRYIDIVGNYTNGGTIDTTVFLQDYVQFITGFKAIVFSDAWVDLSSVSLSAAYLSDPSVPLSAYAYVAIDNFDISASSSVPVPGAVWLLGSGLAGLAGLRRKKNKKELP